ncbi:MAG: hypothetical protein Q8M95_08850 [Candidatus Methanoperedens sp.]|nr:hypothetical protein [Candidatus Methanoperedens sp.]
MVSKNKIVSTVIILLLLSVLLSGCIEKENTASGSGSDEKSPMLRNLDTGEEYISEIITKNAHAGFQKRLNTSPANLALLSKDGNIPEIKINSFSSIYKHDNSDDWDMHLFNWENVPGNESDGLINYLLDIDQYWVTNARIIKTDENKTIRIFDSRGSIVVKCVDNKSVTVAKSARNLFSWDDVPGNDTGRFIEYLTMIFGIDWAEKAKIEKIDHGRIIKVSNEKNDLSFELDSERTFATLKIDGNDKDFFRANLENGRLNIYDIKRGDDLLLAKKENGSVYKKMFRNKYEPSMRYYAAYNLSIKNNGSSPLYFNLNGLRLYEGNNTFNVTPLEPHNSFRSGRLEVLIDLEKEKKLQDTTLLPGQSVYGTVAFHVNSLYDESFLLTYNATPVTSASFEKGIEALRTAEGFNYSVALGKPPYRAGSTLYTTVFDKYYPTWANWVNRSIFEAFKKSDIEIMQNSSQGLPDVEMVYSLRVIPERNVTMFPIISQLYMFNWDEIPGNDSGKLLDYLEQEYGIDGVKTAKIENLLVIDDAGEELINTSRIDGMAVMSNQTYTFRSGSKLHFPGMNISKASVVYISFFAFEMSSGRSSVNNQFVILDDELNVIVVRYTKYQWMT